MVNPFQVIARGIPFVFEQRDHPLKPLDQLNNKPMETNKFYTNLSLESRTNPAYPFPYSVWWSKQANLLGMAVSHTTAAQRVFGPNPKADPVQYYFNPVGIQSVNFGAAEWTSEAAMGSLQCSDSRAFSVLATINGSGGTLKMPLVSGMGIITGIYEGITPQLNSLVGFNSAERCNDLNGSIQKYLLHLHNQVSWVMYVSGDTANVEFSLVDGHFRSNKKANSPIIVQCATCPDNSLQFYDQIAGNYATSVSIKADVNKKEATYELSYEVVGKSNKTMVMALPHQVESFTDKTKATATTLKLDCPTKGMMTGCLTNSLEMRESDLPADIGFIPRPKSCGCASTAFSSQEKDKLRSIAQAELNQNIDSQANLDSMYFSGKGFDKFANILLVTKYVLRDDELTKKGLAILKPILQMFIDNRQENPLFYDKTYKGLCSVAGFANPLADFGNTYYNDHNFHYGYFLHTAAVIAQLDKEYGGDWLSKNKDWVNALARDTSNPSTEDTEFPQLRCFDFFSGHSFAKGIFASADGKDEESGSEDYNYAFGLKMWGVASGNANLEAQGNLMLAIMKRAMNKYMLYDDNNKTEPANFIKNKVSGILFENKIDHATYFGMEFYKIHGIHMIPLTPVSPYIRSKKFVKEEWDQRIYHRIGQVTDGWRGILMLNKAIFDPTDSYKFFSSDNFNTKHLDPGLSRTWAMTLSKLWQ